MIKDIITNPEVLDLIANLGKPLTNEPPIGPIVTDKGDYILIVIKNPGPVYIRKDNPNDGVITYSPGDVIVTNGPLFDKKEDMLGGFIENGVLKKKFIEPSGAGNFADHNGVIGQKKDGTFFLLTYVEWKNKKFKDSDISWAFQNGPMLVDDNQVLHDKFSPYKEIRSATGYTANGDVIIIETKKKENFHNTGRYAKENGATNAIYLDGDPTRVGYINKGILHGTIEDGTHTMHFTQKSGVGRN